jgi:hypothetical protein
MHSHHPLFYTVFVFACVVAFISPLCVFTWIWVSLGSFHFNLKDSGISWGAGLLAMSSVWGYLNFSFTPEDGFVLHWDLPTACWSSWALIRNQLLIFCKEGTLVCDKFSLMLLSSLSFFLPPHPKCWYCRLVSPPLGLYLCFDAWLWCV